ncbi:Hypothetical predicted protein [Marmota monax]|uniref:Uncharacterized protein n=1 Tax=Marmota monax TaxID=9995 RepID=A0A5E4AIR3_MARMO|nr:hypothetical protein GHT09_019798 [Marmota monax]VTJ57313.1 Hypothetical predicted protein [Marmota monax]
MCLLPAAGLRTLNRSQPSCREKVSWALSFHLCQPPPAPLLNEGHFKRCFSLHSFSCYCCRATLFMEWSPCQPCSIVYVSWSQPISREKKTHKSRFCPRNPYQLFVTISKGNGMAPSPFICMSSSWLP